MTTCKFRSEVKSDLICPICHKSASSDKDLEEHWRTCFEDHSPTKAEARCGPASAVGGLRRGLGELEQTSRCYEAHLGSHRLPPSATALLVDGLLSLPGRLALAQTSTEGKRLVEAWDSWVEFAAKQWLWLWEHSLGAIPSGECGCSFRDPLASPLSPKEVAVRLWRACTLTSVEVKTKGLTGRIHEMILDDSAKAPVLLNTTVRQLKLQYEDAEGPPPSTFKFLKAGSVPLSHASAPLAAYVWDLLDSPGAPARIYLDLTFRSGRCCLEDPDR